MMTFIFLGLILGGGLIVFVCALSDEFGARPMTSSRNVIKLSAFIPNNDSNYNTNSSYYFYGWSFMLAVFGFLSSEISAVLCLTAFLNRFDSEVNTVFFLLKSISLECRSLLYLIKLQIHLSYVFFFNNELVFV